MGWLLGNKKKIVPKVPFPEGQALDDKALSFPQFVSSPKVVEPETLKAAVGTSAGIDLSLAPFEINEPEQAPSRPLRPGTVAPSLTASAQTVENSEMFVKVDAYQHVLGEIEGIRKNLSEMGAIQKKLESSEYYEEEDFDTLQRLLKSMHDGLLKMDKKLYQG